MGRRNRQNHDNSAVFPNESAMLRSIYERQNAARLHYHQLHKELEFNIKSQGAAMELSTLLEGQFMDPLSILSLMLLTNDAKLNEIFHGEFRVFISKQLSERVVYYKKFFQVYSQHVDQMMTFAHNLKKSLRDYEKYCKAIDPQFFEHVVSGSSPVDWAHVYMMRDDCIKCEKDYTKTLAQFKKTHEKIEKSMEEIKTTFDKTGKLPPNATKHIAIAPDIVDSLQWDPHCHLLPDGNYDFSLKLSRTHDFEGLKLRKKDAGNTETVVLFDDLDEKSQQALKLHFEGFKNVNLRKLQIDLSEQSDDDESNVNDEGMVTEE